MQSTWVKIFGVLLVISSYQALAQAEAIAELFGESITLSDINPDNQQLNQLAKMSSVSKDMALAQFRHGHLADKIVDAVLQDYAKTKGITVDDSLVARFISRFSEEISASRAQKDPQSLDQPTKSIADIARTQVRQWQIDKALYEEFGGTVIFQQSNPQLPVGAYETLLKQYQKAGKFTIFDDQYSAVFWEAFEPPFTFVLDPAQVDFSRPWWLSGAENP